MLYVPEEDRKPEQVRIAASAMATLLRIEGRYKTEKRAMPTAIKTLYRAHTCTYQGKCNQGCINCKKFTNDGTTLEEWTAKNWPNGIDHDYDE